MAQTKYEKSGQEIIFGVHPLQEALRAKRRPVRCIYTTKPTPKVWTTIEALVPAHVPVRYVTRDALTKMAESSDHQGIVAFVGQFPLRKKPFESTKTPYILMLDGVQDPRNLGAIIRSAYCAGIKGIVVCRKQGAPLNAVVLKTSAGLAERMEIYEAPSAIAAIQEIQQHKYSIYLAALGGTDIRSVTFQEPLCLVIGSEGTGISEAVLKFGTTVMLPQKSADVSYNASVAAGILLFFVAINKKIL